MFKLIHALIFNQVPRPLVFEMYILHSMFSSMVDEQKMTMSKVSCEEAIAVKF